MLREAPRGSARTSLLPLPTDLDAAEAWGGAQDTSGCTPGLLLLLHSDVPERQGPESPRTDVVPRLLVCLLVRVCADPVLAGEEGCH